MSLLISKDGKQLGPYSLEEARSLVLSGQLDADDWAWPDGATDWVPLKDVPGYTLSKTAPPAAAPALAASPVAEQELWSGHPSQILNLGLYVFWGAILFLAFFAVFMLDVFNESMFWALIIIGAVTMIGLINSAIAYIHLRAIEYVVSTQRIRVISGVFSKDIQEIELFRVKDTMAQQSFFLRLFGLGTITILSGDQRLPRLVLSGIPNAIELREKIREEVMTLRQRFGVREMDVM